jgi:hypothetical protein
MSAGQVLSMNASSVQISASVRTRSYEVVGKLAASRLCVLRDAPPVQAWGRLSGALSMSNSLMALRKFLILRKLPPGPRIARPEDSSAAVSKDARR